MINSSHASGSDQSGDSSPGPAVELDLSFPDITRKQWQELAGASLPSGSSLESLARQTLDGLSIKVLYDQADTPGASLTAIAQAAGRAAATEQYDSPTSSWDNRLSVVSDQNDVAANQHILQGLAGGNTSIELHVNANSQLATLLDGVVLGIAPLSFRAGLHYAAIEQQLAEYCDSQSHQPDELTCYFNADPIGHWLSTEQAGMDINSALADLAQFCLHTHQRFPRSRAIVIDTTIHHNAGASARQELQAAIATGVAYMEAMLDAGLSFTAAANHVVFQLACDADVLMGVVKLRALKLLWQHTLDQLAHLPWACDTTERIPEPMYIVAETSQRYLTHLDPWNNHLRNVAACSAAAMGDAHTIIVHRHDTLIQDQDEDAVSIGVRMARNLPIVLERESGLRRVTDPFAGAYAIETLTSQLAELCWQSLTDSGDTTAWIATLASGQWQEAIAETHHRRLQLLHKEEYIMVGVNRYRPNSDNTTTDTLNPAHSPIGFHRLTPVRDAHPYDTAAPTETTLSQGEDTAS